MVSDTDAPRSEPGAGGQNVGRGRGTHRKRVTSKEVSTLPPGRACETRTSGRRDDSGLSELRP